MKFYFALLCFVAITFAQTTCTAPKIAVTVIRQYAGSAMQEHLYIYEGSVATGTKIADIDGDGQANKIITTEYCLNPTLHTFRGYDGAGNGWTSGSQFTVKIGDIIVLRDTLERGEYFDWPYTPTYSLPKGSSWKYSAIAQAGTTWTATTFSDAAWATYAPGAFPATVAGTARYYRTSVVLPATLASYSVFDLGINAQEGIIIYINGQEIYRRNLAAGTILATSLATTIDTAAAYRRIVHSIKKYLTGVTSATIAVEIHPSATHIAGVDSFDGFFIPIYGECSKRAQDGTPDTIGTVIDTSERADKAFDNNRDTKWCPSFVQGTPVALTYKFSDGRREWISKYTITSADDVPSRDPLDFGFYGSNDEGLSWTLLDINAAVNWVGRKQTKTFLIPSNAVAYNMYKLEVTSVKNYVSSMQFAQVAELNLSGCYADIITGFVYEQPTYTWYTNVDEVYLSPHSSGLSTFTLLSPAALPAGLTFVPTTGEIYGTPTAAFGGAFSISAIDAITQTPVTCSLSITIVDCTYPTFTRLQVQKTNPSGGTAWSEKYQIYSATNQLVLDGEGVEGQTMTHNLCVPAGIYTLKLTDTDSAAWTSSSRVVVSVISVSSTYTIIRTTLVENSQASIKFNAQFLIPEKDSTTLCNINAVAAPLATWYTTAFVQDANWTPCLSTGMFTSNSRAQYFRNTFNVASKTDFNGLEIRLNATTAAVIYLNGQEVYRTNLPAGDVAPTTVSTAATIGYEFRSVTIDPSKVVVGINVIAIAQLLDPTGVVPHTSYFIYSVRQLIETATTSRTWGMTATGVYYSANYASNMFDGDYRARWFWKAESVNYDPVPLDAKYTTTSRYEYFNYYCIIANYDSPQGDPKDWTLSGCVDGANCITLDTETGVSWKARSQRQCFYTDAHTQSFNSYKFTLVKAQGHGSDINMSISELLFHVIDLSTITVGPLAYTPAAVIGYKDVDLTTMTATANYHKFTVVSGALPSGVYMDSNTGYIWGTPLGYVPSVVITIQALTPAGIPATTSITISVGACTAPNSILQIVFSNPGGNSGSQMAFELQDGLTSTRIDYRSNMPDWTTTYYSYCRPVGSYKLVLTDTANDGWGGASIKALASDGSQIGSWTMSANQNPKTVTFETVAIIGPEEISWTFLNSAVIAAPTDNSWTQVSYAAAGWASGTPITMTVPVGVTQYYRTLFTVSNVDTYAGFTFSVALLGGCVAYVNGVEIYRQNMPTGTITSTTLATADYVTVVTTGGSVTVQYSGVTFLNGQNVFAVETHRGNVAATVSYFSASFSMLEENKNMLNNFSTTGAVENTSATENIAKFFDGSVETKWLSHDLCVGAWATVTYKNERREMITSYTISNANDCNARHPNGWKLEGSNDGTTWDMLHQESNHVWTAYKQSATFDFLPSKAYNRIKWTATSCGSAGMSGDSVWCTNANMQMSDISFNLKRIASVCTALDGYSTTVAGSYAYKSCDQYYTGNKRRMCTNGVFGAEDTSLCVLSAPTTLSYPQTSYTFNVNTPITPITPTIDSTALTFTSNFALPSGVTLNPSTGVISGTPSVGANLGQYTITATNTAGSASVTIQITVSGGSTALYCSADGDYAQTLAGTTANAACPAGQTGIRSRLCQTTNPPTWAPETSTCTAAGGAVTLSYPQSVYTLSTGTPQTIVPTYSGTINSWTINPTILPAGLTFSNGIISGVPTAASTATVYTVSAIGSNVATFTLTISVSVLSCPVDGEWPQTAAGQTATLTCEVNKTGTKSRLCQTTGVWATAVNTCVYSAPVISYTPSTINVDVNTAITTMIPTVTGYVTSWSINTQLPAGLTFSTTNGYISGTPTVASGAMSVVVTASNPNASGIFTIVITVTNPQCAADGVWPATNKGVTAVSACTDSAKEGSMTRVCQNTNPPTWAAIIDGCTYKTPTLSFPNPYITAYVNVATSVAPSVSPLGPSYTFSITPPLPSGLTLSSTTGIISGAATSKLASTSYTVTVTNPSGKFSTATFTLTVLSYTCPVDGEWPVTDAGSSAYLSCPGNENASRSRLCKMMGNTGSWELEDATSCLSASSSDNPADGRSYVRFPITITNYNVANIKAKQVDAMRRAFQTTLTSHKVALTSILLESKTGTTSFFADAVKVVLRVECANTEAEAVKTTGTTAVSNGSYISILRAYDSSFNNSTASVDSSSISVTNHNAMTAGIIVLIVVVVIFVIVAVAVVVFCVMNRMKGSKAKANHKKLGKVPKAAAAKTDKPAAKNSKTTKV